jgi:hypothetical protein
MAGLRLPAAVIAITEGVFVYGWGISLQPHPFGWVTLVAPQGMTCPESQRLRAQVGEDHTLVLCTPCIVFVDQPFWEAEATGVHYASVTDLWGSEMHGAGKEM